MQYTTPEEATTMAKYEMITGPFEGMIVEEGHQFLDVSFSELDDDMQCRVRIYAEDHNISNMEDAKERYELSWESREIEEVAA